MEAVTAKFAVGDRVRHIAAPHSELVIRELSPGPDKDPSKLHAYRCEERDHEGNVFRLWYKESELVTVGNPQ